MILLLPSDPDACQVLPAASLGRERFPAFREICDRLGVHYDAGRNLRLAPHDVVHNLIAELEAAGLKPTVHPDVLASVRGSAKAAEEATAAARGRAVNPPAGLSLRAFQGPGVAWLAPRRTALLCDEMGLGKTVQALMAIEPGARVLVVATAKLKRNWEVEAKRWRPEFKTAILDGRESFRWPDEGEIVCTNHDILPMSRIERSRKRAANMPVPAEAPAPPGPVYVIVDEAHRVKSGKALRTIRMRELIRAALGAGGRAWGLTGSPLMNRPEELASLLTTFRLFETSFQSWPNFLRLMNGKKNLWGGFWWGEPRAAAIECLRRVMLRRRFADHITEIPGKLYQDIDVDVDASTRRADAEARAELAARGIDLVQALTDGTELVGFEALSRARKALATCKIPALLELVEEYEEAEEPLVVFSAFRPPIDLLGARKGWGTITGDTTSREAQEVVAAFQAGALKGIALTIRAGGEGLTLTRGHHVLFVDLEWTPMANEQAEARVYRIGQTKGVIVKRLVARKTLDEDVLVTLSAKAKMVNQIINAAARRE